MVRLPEVAVATTLSLDVGTRPSTQVDGEFQFPPASEIVSWLWGGSSVNVQPVLPPLSVEFEPAYQVAPPVALELVMIRLSATCVPVPLTVKVPGTLVPVPLMVILADVLKPLIFQVVTVVVTLGKTSM